MESGSSKMAMSCTCQIAEMPVLKVAQDTCDVTHSLTHASACTSVMSTRQKECTKYSLHLVSSASRHTDVIMLYRTVLIVEYVEGQF